MHRLFLLSVLFFLCCSPAFGQQSWRIGGKSLVELRKMQQQVLPLPRIAIPFSELDVTLLLPASGDRRFRFGATDVASVPRAYRYEDLALFCRIEVQMEQLFKFPVKFRLGEVQYVERMEGKY